MANNTGKVEQEVKTSAIGYAKLWGESALPPMTLATLITAQYARPPQFLPLSFAPVFLFSAYMNVYGYETEAAGLNAAWSGLYFILARRRKQPLMQKWGTRGIVRGATLGLCAANVLGSGFVYATGRKSKTDGESVV